MADDINYEYKEVQAVRGMENRAIAKVQSEPGWELFEQTQGTLRTTLKFRRAKPETFSSKAWAAFRALPPTKQKGVAAGTAVLLLLAAVGIGSAAAIDKGDTKAESSTTEAKTDTIQPTEPVSLKTNTPSPTPAPSEETDPVITVENNKDFAALLAATDYCDPSMTQFADKYEGQNIEFDGSITNMQRHENYNTRYDILLGPGDAGTKTTAGPAFKYDNVNMFDLKFTGDDVPSYVAESDKFRFVAEVGEYNPQKGCLFFLTPVSTTVR